MIYGFLFGFLFVALLCVGIALVIKGYQDESIGKSVSGWVTSVASFILFLCIPFSFHTIDTGEIAVVKEMGKVIDTREAGVHFDFWMVRTYEKYDTKVRQIDITTSAYTAGDVKEEEDGAKEPQLQPIDVQLTLHYQIIKSDVKTIAEEYGSLTLLESRIQAVVTANVKEVIKKYRAAELISERDTLATEVFNSIDQALNKSDTVHYYSEVKTVALTNIDFSDAFEQSVEQSMIANQEIVKARAEAEKAVAAAQGELEVAKLAAQAKIEAAKADAESQKLVAQAEATAVKLKSIEMARALGFKITETEVQGALIVDKDNNPVLDENGDKQYEVVIEYEIDFENENATPEKIELLVAYMQYIEYLNKWDGKLPTVMTDTGVMLQIPKDSTDSVENKQ